MRCVDLESGLAVLAAEASLRQRRVLTGEQGVRVQIDGREMLSFASNDYLGLAAHPEIAAAACVVAQASGVGAGASHLLTGHHALHHALEMRFAAMVGAPAALLFSSGYMANLGVVTAFLGRNDALFADKLNHASLVDAARLSGAKHLRYRHNDMADLERRLAAAVASSPAAIRFIASDTVFSMDGDTAPVAALLALAEHYDAWLLLDDAHGFGVLGEHGQGSLASHRGWPERLIYLATFGKAVGVAGAAVAGSENAIAWLVNRARTYIYTTAQPPMLAAATLKSLDLIAQADDRRAHLCALMAHLRQRLAGLPWPLMNSTTPIQPLLVGDNATAVRLSQTLAERGIWLPAIRPPTVPVGTARLRISLSAAHRFDDLEVLADALWGLAA